MTVNLAALAGVILSVLFEYIPGFSTWYDALKTEQHKRLVMLILVVLSALGLFGWGCYTAVCPDGWVLVEAIIAAIVVNQGVHRLIKK